MVRFFLLFFIFTACFIAASTAQNSCDQSTKQAEELYNSGDYENCIRILEKSFKECRTSKKISEDILELLAKSHLEQDNVVQAEADVKSMLENNPHYELKDGNNNEDFELLVKKFDVHPQFSIGVRNAALLPKLKSTKTFSILNNVDYSAPYTTAKTILIYNIWAEYEFHKGLSLNSEFIDFSLNYNRNFSRGTDWSMAYRENLSFIEVPLYLKKYFPIGKNVMPYVDLGIGYLRMTKAAAGSSIAYINEDAYTGAKTNFAAGSENMDMLKMRNENNYEWIAGAGIGYKFKNLGLFIDARYCGGLMSLTNTSNRFENTALTNNYFYIDNAIKLNKFEIGISISYTLINSIKKIR